jgi:hypothetical protein
MPQNRIPLKSYHYSPQGKRQLGDQRNDGKNNCNSGDGNGQMAQPWMFMIMMMMMMTNVHITGINRGYRILTRVMRRVSIKRG